MAPLGERRCRRCAQDGGSVESLETETAAAARWVLAIANRESRMTMSRQPHCRECHRVANPLSRSGRCEKCERRARGLPAVTTCVQCGGSLTSEERGTLCFDCAVLS